LFLLERFHEDPHRYFSTAESGEYNFIAYFYSKHDLTEYMPFIVQSASFYNLKYITVPNYQTLLTLFYDQTQPCIEVKLERGPSDDSEPIIKAIEAVNATPNTTISILQASKVYKLSLSILCKHLKVLKKCGYEYFSCTVKYDMDKIFSDGEEQSLAQYI
jgi:hypothetical protein